MTAHCDRSACGWLEEEVLEEVADNSRASGADKAQKTTAAGCRNGEGRREGKKGERGVMLTDGLEIGKG
jgi:hypothetical protein